MMNTAVQPNEWYDDIKDAVTSTTVEITESCSEYVLMQDDHGYDYLSLCEWSISNVLAQEYGLAVDLQFTVPERHPPGSLPSNLEAKAVILDPAWTPLKNALIAAARTAEDGMTATVRTIRVIVPRRSGYVASADWIQRRFADCGMVEQVACFSSPRTLVKASTTSILDMSLQDLLHAACAGFLLTSTAIVDEVDTEFADRLDDAWISPVMTAPRLS
ncbi:hypothetical protein LTR78_008677 [Recurvomyces mirabilis]|uniref:Uncharacterized protein n=1 Tax=Recurvomyces mirabilis TaxID=574656 RepID=A0AAE0WIW3_9PEZI|nr:hypothetical protein LTR78_008677 [Recurvomyces mirabilis]KAK5159238.1 hypothetical protein LTS14_002380 [Recurvomyces mirabilis]